MRLPKTGEKGHMAPEPSVTRWHSQNPPTEPELEALLLAEGLHPYRWANDPGDRYAPHSHAYHKVLYVVTGSITFLLHSGATIRLEAGDRLDLPAGTIHSAIVGPEGVVCLEGHRPPST